MLRAGGLHAGPGRCTRYTQFFTNGLRYVNLGKEYPSNCDQPRPVLPRLPICEYQGAILMNKQTSSRVSSIAARLINFDVNDAQELRIVGTSDDITEFCSDVRTLAASALGQDETPGQAIPIADNLHMRLQRERDDLDRRLGKLIDFLNRGAPGTTPRHKAMLDEQNRLMSELLAILDERLCDLTISQRSEATATRDGQPIPDDDNGDLKVIERGGTNGDDDPSGS